MEVTLKVDAAGTSVSIVQSSVLHAAAQSPKKITG
jgi:hypothetical protein